jgi:hypothetical protein
MCKATCAGRTAASSDGKPCTDDRYTSPSSQALLSAYQAFCAQPTTASEPATTLLGIKNAIMRATGAQAQTIELSTTSTTFTMLSMGNSEASAIKTVVVNAIKEKERFNNIVVIVVQY